MRNRRPDKTTVTISYTDDRYPIDSATFAISGTLSPVIPACMYGGPDGLGWPAEGGDIEITAVQLTEWWKPREGDERMSLDEDADLDWLTTGRKKEIEDRFSARIDMDQKLRETIYERFCEEAADAAEYCGD